MAVRVSGLGKLVLPNLRRCVECAPACSARLAVAFGRAQVCRLSGPGQGRVWIHRAAAEGARKVQSMCTAAATAAAVVAADAELGKKASSLVVVSFYKFADVPDYESMKEPLRELCNVNLVSGHIILAAEGINGSICGTAEAVERVLATVQRDPRLAGIRMVEAPAGPEDELLHHGHTEKSPLGAGDDAPFRWDHVRVRLKKEVVPLGVPGVNPALKVGEYVKPKDWNAVISDPRTVVIDVRNDYEVRIGKFRGAVDPKTTAFRDFPAWVEDHLGSLGEEGENEQEPLPRVAMYCTGGIRCEKASSFLLSKGFEEVYHLEGGILKYLEEVPASESLWEGECFVFDKRVAVEHGHKQGSFRLCYACKKPVNDQDEHSPLWEEGVSCPHCFYLKTPAEKERARARQKQFEKWGKVGGPHGGRRKPSVKTNQDDDEHKYFFTRCV